MLATRMLLNIKSGLMRLKIINLVAKSSCEFDAEKVTDEIFLTKIAL